MAQQHTQKAFYLEMLDWNSGGDISQGKQNQRLHRLHHNDMSNYVNPQCGSLFGLVRAQEFSSHARCSSPRRPRSAREAGPLWSGEPGCDGGGRGRGLAHSNGQNARSSFTSFTILFCSETMRDPLSNTMRFQWRLVFF